MAENEQVEQVKTEVEQVEAPDPITEKARAMGHVAKEDFRGDPEKWVDAETFVKRSENILPIVKERLDHVIKENQELKESFREFNEYHKKTAEREFNRALQAIEQKKLDAVESADVQGYHQAEAERRDLLKEHASPPSQPERMGETAEFKAFTSSNDWYGKDSELTNYADIIGKGLAGTPGMTNAALLSKVAEEVKARYPQKFQNTRREGASSVERSPDTGLPVKTGKTYADLPADAKTACDKFIRTIPGFTKEQYLAEYQW